LSPEDALRVFSDPQSYVFIEITSVRGVFEFTFEMPGYRIVRAMADRLEPIELAQTILDVVFLRASLVYSDIDDESRTRCVSEIIDEVATKGRYGNRPGGEQSSDVVVVTA
jgi:hypothetical protein